MDSNLLGLGTAELARTVLDDADGPVLVVNPSAAVIEATIEAGADRSDDGPELRVLADEGTLKEVFEDFILASEAADLMDAGTLELRSGTTLPQASLFVTDDAVVALVNAGDRIGGLVADDAEFVGDAGESYGREWERGSPFTLRTPPLSRVRSTIDEDLGSEVRDDFDGVLSSLATARGDDDLDEVTVSLLVAAKNDVLLYDVSKWGEDVGIASKATFSRTKTRLEDLGLIDTEKVPIEVGRPRLRLKLSDDRLRDADPADLASVAQSVLAS